MSWFAEFSDLARAVPSAFWGIVAGSFFSLGGVVLTNRANDRRLRAQLSHDRELRISDRDLALRKDIYLAAAEALFAGIVSIGKFANLDIPFDKVIEGYTEKSPAVAKVHVIANEDTLRAVSSITHELGAAFMQLIAKRVPLMVMKSQSTQLDEQLANAFKNANGTIELMKNYNLEGASNQRRWAVIQGNYELEQKTIADSRARKEVLSADLYTKQLEYMEECVAETMRLGQLLTRAVIAVRKELGLPIDETSYAAIMRETQEKQTAGLAEFVEQARTFIVTQPGPAD